ncbi:MAG: ABC transporter permease [Anaeroplasmataceae bacterium]
MKDINSKKYKKNKFNYSFWFIVPFILLLSIFVIIPMLSILFYSIVDQTSEFPIYRLSFLNYIEFFKKSEYLIALGKSLYFALVATICCFLISYPLAYFISKRKKATQAILMLLVTAPMWINMLLRTLAIKQILDGPLLNIFQALGFTGSTLLGNDFAIILGMIYIYLPFMILPIYTIMSKIDYNLVEASRDLGASKKKNI